MRRFEGNLWNLYDQGAWVAVSVGLDGSLDGIAKQAKDRMPDWARRFEAQCPGMDPSVLLYVDKQARIVTVPVRTRPGVHAAKGLITRGLHALAEHAEEFKPQLAVPLLGVGGGDCKAGEIVPRIERAFMGCPWAVLVLASRPRSAVA